MSSVARHCGMGWLLGVSAAVFLFSWVGCGGSRPAGSGPDGIDRDFVRLSRTARVNYGSGQIARAIEGYKKALERAYISDDFDAIVDTLYNLSVCHLWQEEYEAALENVQNARNELTNAGRPLPADLLLVEAMALYHSGAPDRAWQLTDVILARKPAPAPDTLSRMHFLRGRAAADRGDSDQLRIEIAALGEPTAPGLQADRFELVGRLAMLDERWNDAVAALDQAAGLRAETRNYRVMAATLATAAQSCERAQRPGDAAYRFLRAARSAGLSGDTVRASAWLQETVRLAEQTRAELILQAAHDLQAILSQESRPHPLD